MAANFLDEPAIDKRPTQWRANTGDIYEYEHGADEFTVRRMERRALDPSTGMEIRRLELRLVACRTS